MELYHTDESGARLRFGAEGTTTLGQGNGNVTQNAGGAGAATREERDEEQVASNVEENGNGENDQNAGGAGDDPEDEENIEEEPTDEVRLAITGRILGHAETKWE